MAHANPYLSYYRNQVGGRADIPVFIGGQHGEGLGDFFRSMLRFIAPIALRGLSTFASTTQRAHESGASLKDAARSAIGPSLGAMAGAVGETMKNRQAGMGQSNLFSGEHGVPYANTKHVYKAIASHRSSHHPYRRTKSKRKTKRKPAHHGETEYNF